MLKDHRSQIRRLSTANEGKIWKTLNFTKDGKENNEYNLLEHIQHVKTLKFITYDRRERERMNKTRQNSTNLLLFKSQNYE